MSSADRTNDFAALLSMSETAPSTFVAEPPGEGFLFGGLTMALILRAAGATVGPSMVPRSLHTLFVRAGEWGPALDISVEAVHDSRAFGTRQVSISQGGRLIATAAASFHVPEPGEDRQTPAPEVPPPEALPPSTFNLGNNNAPPVEIRLVSESAPGHHETIHPYWGRSVQPLPPDDQILRWCALLFVSDYMVIGTPFPRASGAGREKFSRTLGHTIWFHRPVLDDDWLLYSCDAASVFEGRFVSLGTVHDRSGRLLATFTQEGLIRPARSEA